MGNMFQTIFPSVWCFLKNMCNDLLRTIPAILCLKEIWKWSKQVSKSLVCYVFGVCVCVRGSCGRDGRSLFWEGVHFTWRNSVAAEMALPNGNDDCFSVAQRQRRLGVFVSRTAAGRHLFETNDALKEKTPGRQRQRYWQYFQLIEYLTCITYIIQNINTGSLSCFCVLVPALKICES